MDPILTTLSVLVIIFIIFGLFENYFHQKALSNIPVRIHVNGTRGKSSVTRLIASGLRGGNLKTIAKTTGTTPRIINEYGKDVAIHRLRSASIGEQIKLMRYFSTKKPDVLVIECIRLHKDMKDNITSECESSAQAAGEVANSAGVKMLVLTHQSPDLDQPFKKEQVIQEVQKSYNGRIEWAVELEQICYEA